MVGGVPPRWVGFSMKKSLSMGIKFNMKKIEMD